MRCRRTAHFSLYKRFLDHPEDMLTVWESDSLRCTGKSADAILPPFMKLDPSYQALASDFLATHRSTLHEDRLEVELIRIQHISANVASLANKRVLDLGCGSAKNKDSHWNPIGRLWQRWIKPKEFAKVPAVVLQNPAGGRSATGGHRHPE